MAMALSQLTFLSSLPQPKLSPSSKTSISFPSAARPIRRRFDRRNSTPALTAALAVESPSVAVAEGGRGVGDVLLEVRDLTAVISESRKPVLKGVNLTIRQGEIHAVMGKNGSGKSTFAKVLTGHRDYEVTGGSVLFKSEDLLEMEPEDRSLAGLFMSFQSPVEIPGVSNSDFLRMAYNAKRKKLGLAELDPFQFYAYVSEKVRDMKLNVEFLNRNVNEGFSGGEKKRNEILQLAVLGADLAVLDEIDSGLDVDALTEVANAVKGVLTPSNSVLMITHRDKLLEHITPSYVHVMDDGRIVKTGDISLSKLIESEGYKSISAA